MDIHLSKPQRQHLLNLADALLVETREDFGGLAAAVHHSSGCFQHGRLPEHRKNRHHSRPALFAPGSNRDLVPASGRCAIWPGVQPGRYCPHAIALDSS
jgi:hypothetical protein